MYLAGNRSCNRAGSTQDLHQDRRQLRSSEKPAGEPRDYVDTAAALGRYTVRQLIGLAMRLDPGLTERDFADACRQLDRMPDQLFARYGISPADVADLRERFKPWPRSVPAG